MDTFRKHSTGSMNRVTTNVKALVVLIALLITGCSNDRSDARPDVETNSTKNAATSNSTLDRSLKQESKIAQPSGCLAKFVDVAAEYGVQFQRDDDMRGQRRLMEGNGGGVALWDFDADGWLDVLFTNGCRYPNDGTATEPLNALYRSLDGKRFEDVAIAAGITRVAYQQGCAVGDFDSDGFDDLYVAACGHNTLWHNNGDGTFDDVTINAHCDSDLWSTSCAWGDVNGDGWLDLFVTNYVDAIGHPPRRCERPDGSKIAMQCSPTLFPASPDCLFLNDGAGGFRDVTEAAKVAGIDGKGLGVVLFDMNHDGKLDIFVANDGMPNFLYVNETPGSSDEATIPIPVFVERALELGVALGEDGRARAGMGIACGDYDQDGWPDLLVTNYSSEPNSLFRNLNGTSFEGRADATRLRTPSMNVLGFGTEFLDFDNNGRLDLFVANGHVDDLRWSGPHERYQMPPQIFRNEDSGIFRDISLSSGTYFQTNRLGRGTAQGDWDRDGDQDLMVSHQLAPAVLLRNDTPCSGKSLTIKLIGLERSSRTAIGARCDVEINGRKLNRPLYGGGSFQSASASELHLGLGAAEAVSNLRLHWPSGRSQVVEELSAGHWLIVEGQEPVRAK